MLWMFLMMLTVIVTFVLGTVFGYKRATQYRINPMFQYAMLIAHTAPEEWEVVNPMTFRHPDLGLLSATVYSLRREREKGGEREKGFTLADRLMEANEYNQLRNAIMDGHYRILMRKRTDRLTKETAEAVAQMNTKKKGVSSISQSSGDTATLSTTAKKKRILDGTEVVRASGCSENLGHQHNIAHDETLLWDGRVVKAPALVPARVVAYQIYLMDGRSKRIPVTWYRNSKLYQGADLEKYHGRFVEAGDVPDRAGELPPLS